MKKRFVVIIVLICVIAAILPLSSRAAIAPYFIAVNDTLLPFNIDNMPYMSGSEYFVPHGVFGGLSIWSVASSEQVCIYIGSSRFVIFNMSSGLVEDQDGNILPWPSARRSGNRLYVPLNQVCGFFGLTAEILEVGRDIIQQEQVRVIRIRPTEGFTGINGQSFVGVNRGALRTAFSAYYDSMFPPSTSPGAPPSTQPSTPPGESPAPPPVEEPPPKYDDVTIHHSFYNISAGGTDAILELLSGGETSNYHFCFFVSADDIRQNAGLVRKISGNGHSVGIRLAEGTFDEYYRVSELLFEAAKIKTVLVLVDGESENVPEIANGDGIILWKGVQSLVYDDTFSVDAVTEMLPTQSGARQNLVSSCSGITALMLSGILTYLRDNEYTVTNITETVPPL